MRILAIFLALNDGQHLLLRSIELSQKNFDTKRAE